MIKVLGVPDMHNKDADYTSIQGFVNNLDYIYEQLMSLIIREKINIVILFGDIFDGGYSKVNILLSHINWLTKISELLNGELYLNIGNHYFINRGNNPEVYLTQPCMLPNPEYQPVKKFTPPNRPLLRVVDKLMVEHVQFAFHHYSELDKEYTTERDIMADYVVGIYHDEVTLPYFVLKNLGMEGVSQNSYISRIYKNVDMAWHGHIHIPQPPMQYEHTGLIIPGACSPTQNSIKYKTSQISLPVLSIEHGTHAVSFIPLNTGADSLTYFDRRETTVQKATKKLREKARSTKGLERVSTYSEYLSKKGYPDVFKQIADMGLRDKLTVQGIVAALNKQSEESGLGIDEILKGNA